MDSTHSHEFYMRLAIEQAAIAQSKQEVPVGAIVVLNGEIIGKGYNLTISQCDPSLHAEMVAIKQAAQTIQNYRLLNAELYVTLEPCAMCAGLLVHSRISRLVYGAPDYKAGASGSIMNITQHPQLNHRIDVIPNVLQEECSEQLSGFFRERRALKKAMKAKNNASDRL